MLVLSNAPHIKSKESIPLIMWTVVAALVPQAVYSVYLIGTGALFIYLTAVLSAVLSELAVRALLKKNITVHDGSAALTGLLLAMNVPPSAPLWMVAIGSAFAVIIVKQLFGGLGFNIFNPALAARAFLMASWPLHMTSGWSVFSGTNVMSQAAAPTAEIPRQAFDVITSATPLQALKELPRFAADAGVTPEAVKGFLFSGDIIKSLGQGNIGGCIGETSALLLLLGGLFLLFRRVITWHIPAAYIGTVALLACAYYMAEGSVPVSHAVAFHLLSGGLFLGAFFMATDMVTSPVTPRGMLIFGAGCGVITFVIRIWGGYPEGVSYSILLMNAFVPLIDRYLRPAVFGTGKKKSKGAANDR